MAGAVLLLTGTGRRGARPSWYGGDDEAVAKQAKSCLRLMPEQEEGPFYVDTLEGPRNTVEGQEWSRATYGIRVIDHTSVSRSSAPPATSGSATPSASTPTRNPSKPSALTYLRGVQFTDSEGWAEFKTIYPGHYAGRATHIHVRST